MRAFLTRWYTRAKSAVALTMNPAKAEREEEYWRPCTKWLRLNRRSVSITLSTAAAVRNARMVPRACTLSLRIRCTGRSGGHAHSGLG